MRAAAVPRRPGRLDTTVLDRHWGTHRRDPIRQGLAPLCKLLSRRCGGVGLVIPTGLAPTPVTSAHLVGDSSCTARAALGFAAKQTWADGFLAPLSLACKSIPKSEEDRYRDDPQAPVAAVACLDTGCSSHPQRGAADPGGGCFKVLTSRRATLGAGSLRGCAERADATVPALRDRNPTLRAAAGAAWEPLPPTCHARRNGPAGSQKWRRHPGSTLTGRRVPPKGRIEPTLVAKCCRSNRLDDDGRAPSGPEAPPAIVSRRGFLDLQAMLNT